MNENDIYQNELELTDKVNDIIRQIIADRYKVCMTIKEVNENNEERIVKFNCKDEIEEQ